MTLFTNLLQNPIFKMILSYVACILAHFMASHLYIRFCVPNTLVGLLLSPFMTLAPHCQAFRWVIYHGGNTINLLWFILANYLVSKCTSYYSDLHNTNTK